MTNSIPLGVPTTIAANTAYALPAVKSTLFTDATTPTITQSNTQAFSASAAVTLSDGAAVVSAAFLKCTTGILLVLKRD